MLRQALLAVWRDGCGVGWRARAENAEIGCRIERQHMHPRQQREVMANVDSARNLVCAKWRVVVEIEPVSCGRVQRSVNVTQREVVRRKPVSGLCYGGCEISAQ